MYFMWDGKERNNFAIECLDFQTNKEKRNLCEFILYKNNKQQTKQQQKKIVFMILPDHLWFCENKK